MLKIKSLYKKFKNKVVLDNVSLDAKKGSITVLLGSSGVGKSTLLRILNNLEKLDSGTVTLDEKVLNLNNVNKNHITGIVFQHFNLFENLTVLENVTLALIHLQKMDVKEANKKAIKLLHEYNLNNEIDFYPSKLSGGQKQRVALVRALILDPQIICLDEPTSALDPILTNFVAEMIQDLAIKNKYVLVATHDTSLLNKLNCTIHLMQNGKIVESAKSSEYHSNKEKFPLIYNFTSGQK